MHAVLLRIFGALPRFARARIVRILYPTFTAGTAVILQRPDGRVLLVTQSYSRDWSLPGGLMDKKESPGETAGREVMEELGVLVDLDGEHPIPIRSTQRVHFTFVFHAEVSDAVADAAKSTSVEITGVEWFHPDTLPELFDDTALYLEAFGLTRS